MAKKKKKAAKKDAPAVPVLKKLKIREGGPAKVLSSKVSYSGPLFRVLTDEIQEPNGKKVRRVEEQEGSAGADRAAVPARRATLSI